MESPRAPYRSKDKPAAPDGTAVRLAPEFSARIALLRFVMICGIVWLHVPGPPDVAATLSPVFAGFRRFFADGLFRATVPVLTTISGYLLFMKPQAGGTVGVVTRKTRTLLGPLILWNLPLMLILYMAGRWGADGDDLRVEAYPFTWATWLDGVLGLTENPVNYPLIFLRDLFVIVCLYPIWRTLLRYAPVPGLVLVIVVFWFDLDGQFVIRSLMPINFYIAALLAVKRVDLSRLDRYWPLCLIGLLAACVWLVTAKPGTMHWFRLFAPFLIWPVSSLVSKMARYDTLHAISRFSFAIFLLHAPLLHAASIALRSTVGLADHFVLFWLLGPAAVILAIIGFKAAVDRFAPAVAYWCFGGGRTEGGRRRVFGVDPLTVVTPQPWRAGLSSASIGSVYWRWRNR